MVCPKCGSTHVNVSAVSEKRVSGFKLLIDLILVPFLFGIFMLISDITKMGSTDTVVYAVCQNCGNKWEIKN